MPHVPSSAWGPPHMMTKGERSSSGRMVSPARARQQQPIAPEMMPSMLRGGVRMEAVCVGAVGENARYYCRVCAGDVASSGLLLDYGEVTSHAGKE